MDTSQSVQTNWKTSFFTIWAGQAFSLLGSHLVQFALVWYLTRQTGSATVLAIASLFAILPQILIGPLAGALVDRWNRKTVMIAADGLVALATLGLMALFWTGRVQVWHIYLILSIRSAGGAFHFPAMQASTSLLVPTDQLSRVAGLNQALQGAMAIVAPPLGAVLMGLLPLYGVLSIDVGTALLAILTLSLVRIPQPRRQAAATPADAKGTFLTDFRAGLRYVTAWPGLMIMLGISMAINFMVSPAVSLMPLLVTKHFGGGIYQLSWMESAIGLGVVIGGVALSVWGGFRNKVITSLFGLVLVGMGVLAVGLAPAHAFWLGLAGVFVAGLFNPITNGPLFAVLQSTIPADMQGRVLALVGSLGMAMAPLSMLVAGPLSDRFGIPLWYIVSGAVCLLMGIVARFVPAFVNLEEMGPPIHQEGKIPDLAVAAAD
jgi:DHA3 family macrolide efflux protein-like MFS transporter